MNDRETTLMASSTPTDTTKAAAVAAAEKEQQKQPPLNCPRCDSSNTKFCYYNNYSLSQPRHFCKACKRYWTRGGTLRNVPVGGGCRKNKRPKRHSSAAPQSHAVDPHHPSPSNHMHDSNLFYGLSSNPIELNFPFSTFRVSSDSGGDGGDGGYDLHPQINGALGLGFSSPNGFKPIQEASSSPFSTNNNSNNNSNSIFFGSSTMASLLASSHKFGGGAFSSYEDPKDMGNKQVKAEGEGRLQGWNPNPSLNPNHHLMEQTDPNISSSSLVWNTSSMGAWFDPSTMGSSVPSLI